MILEISDKCPECVGEHMQEENREVEYVPSMDYDIPDSEVDYSLTEYCPDCGFEQTKYACEYE